ncbi:WD domain, G-beta repeat domain containing protein [Musa troglodytarum]|uniref:WD domain, G-beta repeat domain containing protein n=1 Tax=Musa troglodytarum TaxID=320322 RepID=A0A9E7K5W0_9LILI|nr:WD domain, G-beta repeat domain containing protein [Musa troglodytarum]
MHCRLAIGLPAHAVTKCGRAVEEFLSRGIEKVAWEASGERLALSYKDGDDMYGGLIAIYDTKRTPLVSASLVAGAADGVAHSLSYFVLISFLNLGKNLPVYRQKFKHLCNSKVFFKSRESDFSFSPILLGSHVNFVSFPKHPSSLFLV